MITNTGKEIIAKYLMGIAPAYASYLAIGCGPKPRFNINALTGCSSSGTTVTTTSTTGLWVGASVYHVTAGTGSIPSNAVVASIISSTQFTLSIAPTVALSGATVVIEIDKNKQVLDFEMFRIPISSRGYVNDGTYDKIVFTAELPTEERYEITEIGLYSAGSNPSAGSYDSKTLFAFNDSENWQLNNGSTLTSPKSIISNIIDPLTNILTTDVTNENAVQTLSNNAGFLNSIRAGRYERCRYFNNIIMLKGNNSYLSNSSGTFAIGSTSKFLQLTGQTLDFTRNSTSDLIKIAFSIINVKGSESTNPDKARVLVEFSSSDGTQYARINAEATATANGLSSNRYVVVSKRLDELTYSSTFSWNAMSVVKIYVSTINDYTITNKAYSSPYATLTTSTTHNLQAGDIVKISGVGTGYDGQFVVYDAPTTSTFRYAYTTTPSTTGAVSSVAIEAASSKYYIALDAIRFDNVGTVNPLYGMTGYSIVQDITTTGSTPAQTIVKSSNSNNYIEYRLIVDVT